MGEKKLRPITVMIADDERQRVRTCLRLLKVASGIRVVGKASTARDAIAAASLRPHVLLFDLKMARGNGVSPLLVLKAKSPRTKIILLTGRASETQILRVIAHGARGYLGAKLLPRFLVKAVRAVDAGESWVSRTMVTKIIDQLARLNAEAARTNFSLV